jgi:outer membrane protein TolC
MRAARGRALGLLPFVLLVRGGDASPAPSSLPAAVEAVTSEAEARAIDLATVLRLAHAQNLNVQIAAQRREEARAVHRVALEQFFPWLSPGLAYRRHDDLLQDTGGDLVEVHKGSYAPGASLAAQTDVGGALYRSRETRALSRASEHGLAAQRAESVLAAAQAYFDLARAQAAVAVAEEALRISREHEDQLHRAVGIGLAFRGEELRVKAEAGHNALALRQTREQQRVAGIRLAQMLQFDPRVELRAEDAELMPLSLVPADASLDSLVELALAARPELAEEAARLAAARDAEAGVRYGPLFPTFSAQVFAGGLGGGRRGRPGAFGASEDYVLALGWRIGPGGLRDAARVAEARARLEGARLRAEKRRQAVVGEVVEAVARVASLSDQIATAKETLAAAEETLRMSQERKEFGVAEVLERILAEQDLTRARTDYLSAVAEYDKAQFALARAVGQSAALALLPAR